MKVSVASTRYPRLIVTIFAVLILLGTALLALPVSSKSGEPTPLIDALFTAASASCVTGLVVYDTYIHWSIFGQIVIMALVQIGGIGFMAIAATFSLLLRRRIGLNERMLLMEASGSEKLGGIVRLTKKIIFGTLIFEGAGCLLLSFSFCPRMGFWQGLYNAAFHSVSAFCNAGFDLMGKYSAFSSLSAFSGDFLACAVIALLVVVGSIGFLVWDDVLNCKWRWHKLSLHSKVVLITTLALILAGALFYFFFEEYGALQDMSLIQRTAGALFHSVSMRTSGFVFIDMASLSAAGVFLTILFMIVGGSPGSAAGGIKTTTLFTLFAATRATLGNRQHITAFKRQIDESALRRACSIITIYLAAALTGVVVIYRIQPLPLDSVIFEVFSAIGTVGLSTGITPELHAFPKLMLVCLMYFGRATILSIVFAFVKEHQTEQLRYPQEKIIIG